MIHIILLFNLYQTMIQGNLSAEKGNMINMIINYSNMTSKQLQQTTTTAKELLHTVGKLEEIEVLIHIHESLSF